jgi:hypothetical protein
MSGNYSGPVRPLDADDEEPLRTIDQPAGAVDAPKSADAPKSSAAEADAPQYESDAKSSEPPSVIRPPSLESKSAEVDGPVASARQILADRPPMPATTDDKKHFDTNSDAKKAAEDDDPVPNPPVSEANRWLKIGIAAAAGLLLLIVAGRALTAAPRKAGCHF